jgi:hypothetical protein
VKKGRATFLPDERKFIHEIGEKAAMDRAACSTQYEQLCSFFHVKRRSDAEVAQLSNLQFYRMNQDIFKRQSHKGQMRYAQEMYGNTHREYRMRPLAFRWFYIDLMNFGGGSSIGRTLTAPFRYVRFRIRTAQNKKRRIAAEKAKSEEANADGK